MSAIDPVTLITTVGFPIAAFLMVYLDLRVQIKKLDETVAKLCSCMEKMEAKTN